MSETAIFTYKCDNIYNSVAERSINPFDNNLGIDWLVSDAEQIVSEKDKVAPLFADAEMNFEYYPFPLRSYLHTETRPHNL